MKRFAGKFTTVSGCNCVCPARVHTPFVDGFLARSYPGQEAEMFARLSAPMQRRVEPREGAVAAATGPLPPE